MKRFYFAAALAALAFTACSTEESVQPVPESAPIHFKSVSSLDVVTRAATPEDFVLDFNAFVTNTAMDAAKLVKYTAPNSWAFADGVDVAVDRTGGTLVAWYPTDLSVTATKTDGVKFTLTAQKDDATKDLIYQYQPVAAPNADKIAVVMGHAYAKLSFKVVQGEGYTVENPSLTAVKINKGIYATGDLNMLTGALTPAAAGAVGTLSLVKSGGGTLEKALVVPMASKPSIEITCTVDEKDYTTTIEDTENNMPSLEAGTEYEITLHVVGQNAAFTSVKQVPWETQAVNGGDIF